MHALRPAFTYSSHALTHALRPAFTYSSRALTHALRPAFTYSSHALTQLIHYALQVRSLIDRGDYTFRDCVEHKAIMHHFVRGRMKNGIKDVAQRGYPIKDVEDVVPTRDDIYEYHAGMSYKKGITRPHRDVPFLRGASADAAILALKNECKYLVRVRARDMPSGQDWDNFAEVGALKSSAHVLVRALRRQIHCLLYKFMQVLWTFFVYYCHYEGLQMTHDMTRRVLMYVFYGHYTISRGQMFVYKHRRACIHAFVRLYKCVSIPFFDMSTT